MESNMIIGAVIGVVLGAIIAVIIIVINKKAQSKNNEQVKTDVVQNVELRIREMMPELMREASSSLISMADQKLGAEKNEIKTDLENKRFAIETLVKKIEEELNKTNQNLDKAEKERIGSYNELKTEIDLHRKVTDQLSITTDQLKRVLSNNQMRGAFGETIAEDLLKMCGFVKGVDFDYNKVQGDIDTRPDFTVFLPDKTRINVDVKFPYASLQKWIEAENEGPIKEQYKKEFEQAVKNKIKQVTTRDYISPENNTVDFVIMFIPNEMIFSYIYDKMNDVWQEAMAKKVVMAGPFSFTAILRMVRQAYDNFKYEKNIRQIISHVQEFEKEFDSFNTEFVKIGERIDSLQKQYNVVSTTRSNQLVKRMDRIKLEGNNQDSIEIKQPKLID
ncbi:MAG TPA: DNA recombination protein RmuC [Candidatus Dojkabacteria bacterium]|nr:DNA recombination protein RmuC [Candidatus Dojkabacteria bacterium]